MSWMNNLWSESDFVIWGCWYEDCDSCPQTFCSEDLLGRWVKSSRVSDGLWKEIKDILVLDKWDSL